MAFQSANDKLVPGDSVYTLDLFIYDRQTKTIRLIGPLAASYGNYEKTDVTVSAGGRYAAYTLHDGTPFKTVTDQVYLSDMASGQSYAVSVNAQGMPGNHNSASPRLTDNGRSVVFHSLARDLIQPRSPASTPMCFLSSLALLHPGPGSRMACRGSCQGYGERNRLRRFGVGCGGRRAGTGFL
ncbi:hypothetical protein N6H14_09205 [Paenibacillus sp. CC-CFT747]|nr:hypothetical protein N6H14_09205 [Paenibacillus sp. CC-CFT747]